LIELFLMSEKQYSWHKIADSLAAIDFNANGLAECKVADKNICLSRQSETVHACAAKCPHAGGKMADGYLDALGNIVCPLHRYKFSLKNGRNVSGEGYFLKNYPVEIRDEGVFVGFEQNKFLNWLK
jgi:nitrite reductase/ring-hydroxylating ferredoxin subunit